MSMYGMAEPTKAGHWLCGKCNTWNREYTNTTKEVVCPFCSAPKDVSKIARAKPEKIDYDLYAFLIKASEEDIERIKEACNIGPNIFVSMRSATLNTKKAIMAFIEDNLL